MFRNLGSGEVVVLLLLILFLFGPDRLPGAIQEAARGLRQVRRYLTSMSQDVREELGPELGELDLVALRDPQAFLRKHLWDDDEKDLDQRPSTRPRRPTSQDHRLPSLAAGETAPWDPDTT